MSNPMFRGKGPAMISGNFATNFPLKHQQKDMKYVVEYPSVYLFSHDGLFNCIMLRLALDLASQHGVELPTSTAANNIYVKAMDAPLNAGDDDFSAVYKAV